MLILAIDTSHKNGSVCLARGDGKSFELIEVAMVDGGTFSAQLVPVISKLLANNSFTKKDVQGVAAAVGPGSFTGLRIGLSAVKGLAEVLRVPIAAVSVLEAIASTATKAGEGQRVIAAMDAGRAELYVGEYQGGERIAEFLCTRSEFVAQLRKRAAEIAVVTPEAAVAELANDENVRCEIVPQPGSEMIARLGLRKLSGGDVVSIEELDANYVRRDESLFTSG
ncbi:MAG: peptidase glycoprotease [Acidobacteriales bacterium]|nr:peptidase glycoprotease [Terriglobales bacterium]